MNLHQINLVCGKCDSRCYIVSIFVHADCYLLVEGICGGCAKQVEAQLSFGGLLRYAVESDMNDSFVEDDKKGNGHA